MNASTLPRMTLRRVTPADARLIFDWANDSDDRASSFDPSLIRWEDHVSWLARKLTDSNVHFFIALDADQPVGQVRLEVENDITQVASVGVGRTHRGQGLGPAIIIAGVRELVQLGFRRFYAFALPNNVASVRSFERAGFVRGQSHRPTDVPAVYLAFDMDAAARDGE